MASDERAAVYVGKDPDGTKVKVTLDGLRAALAAQGLTVVTEAEKRTLDIGKAVLDMQVPEDKGGGFYFDETARRKLWDLCQLARRGANPIDPLLRMRFWSLHVGMSGTGMAVRAAEREPMNKAEYQRRFEAMERQLKLEGASLGHAMACASMLAMEYTNARWQEALLVIARKLGSDKDWETVIEEARKKLAE